MTENSIDRRRFYPRCRCALFRRCAIVLIVATAAVRATPTPPGAVAMEFAAFGADNPGGHGGRVIKVTTLARDGDGSFKSALLAAGPRIIVFEVGGVIDWRMDEVVVTDGRLTVAGETAPSPGVTIIRGSLQISAPDVIVRHIAVRVGDGGDLKQAGAQPDSMTVSGPNARRVLIDHCSASWSIDESLSVSGPRVSGGTAGFVTIRNCIVAEALNHSTHPKGPHSKGTLLHDFVQNVALAGNFYASNMNRNPFLKSNTRIFMADNLIYDPGNAAIHFSYAPAEYKVIDHAMLPGELTAVGNVMRAGPSTYAGLKLFSTTPVTTPHGVGILYQDDNRVYNRDGSLLPTGGSGGAALLAEPAITLVEHPLLWPAGFVPLPSEQTEAYVLRNAGSRPRDRNSIDLRILADYAARTSHVIDSQDEVGGYPETPPTHRPLEVPDSAEAVEAWLGGFRSQVEY